MFMKRSLVVFLGLCLLIPAVVCAQLRLPAILSPGMVLQQKDSVALWGWAGPSEKVYVTTGWDNRIDSTITGSGAQWRPRQPGHRDRTTAACRPPGERHAGDT